MQHELNFARQRPVIPLASWLVLAGGCLALIGVIGWHLARSVDGAAEEAAWRRHPVPGEQARAQEPLAFTNQAWRDLRWRQAAQELRRPWRNALAAVDHTCRPPIYLLGLTAAPKGQQLTLDAQGPSLDAILKLVDALGKQPGIADAALRQHTVPTQSGGGQQWVDVVIDVTWGGEDAAPQ
jgi:hypothetical protein